MFHVSVKYISISISPEIMTPPLEKKKILEIHRTHPLPNGPGRIRLYQWSNSASYWYLFVFVAIKPRPHLTLIGPVILQPVEKDSEGRIVFEMDL